MYFWNSMLFCLLPRGICKHLHFSRYTRITESNQNTGFFIFVRLFVNYHAHFTIWNLSSASSKDIHNGQRDSADDNIAS